MLPAGGQERLTLVPSSLGDCLVFLGSAGRARLAASALQPLLGFTPSPCFPYTSSASLMKGRTLTGFIASYLRILICKDPFFQTRSHFSAPADQGVDFSHGPPFTLLWMPLPVASTEDVCLVYSFLVLLYLFCIYVSVVESGDPSSRWTSVPGKDTEKNEVLSVARKLINNKERKNRSQRDGHN